MAILRLKDENGNIVDLPVLIGPQGKTGPAGRDGKDGYTPVKGTDYWTDADKSGLVSDVLAALPVYTGEVESV